MQDHKKTQDQPIDELNEILFRAAELEGGEARLVGADHALATIVDQSTGNSGPKQIIQTQTMEVLGPLARSLVHDLNNLLSIVLGYSGFLLRGKVEGDKDYADLQEISQATRDGIEIVQRLFRLNREVAPRPQPSNLNNEILQIQGLLSKTIPKTLKIDLHLSGDLESVQADRGQVRQILMNLWANARDAMPDGGTLTIETANLEMDEEYCRTHTGTKPGRYVLLTVSDTGHGMNKETQAHIFEPFFSSKEVKNSVAMRLATMRGIVRKHEGNMLCYSEPGHGTTFTICLPAIRIE